MANNSAFLVHFAEGRGNNLGKAKNRVIGWGQFCEEFSKVTRSKERRKTYDKMSEDDQKALKATDGWFIGTEITQGDKRRRNNLKPRDLLTLDYDYATPEFVENIQFGLTGLSGYEFFVHSTRRHTAEMPRLRLAAPLARPVSHDEYLALARILAMIMEDGTNPMLLVDKVSFRIAQMMFKPTASIDGDWFCRRNKGELIDPDAILDAYGDWTNYAELPRTVGETELRKSADKAEDPTTKKGPVGDFCRAYDVPAAIEKFLSDKYAPSGNDYSSKQRYTYLGGSTTDGAVVEDDGLFLYSHHGTDPCADMLVNAFDLVRIHLYGDEDEGVEKDTSPTKMPSYKAMVASLSDDDEYRQAQAQSRYDISAMFDDIADDYVENETGSEEQPEFDDEIERLLAGDYSASDTSDRGAGSPADVASPRKSKKRKPPKTESWFPSALELNEFGFIKSSLPNAAIIIHNDPRLFDAIAFNEFSKQVVARRSIISKLEIAPPFICQDTTNGDNWQDFNDLTIRMILETPNGEGKRGYGMQITDRNLTGAISSAARRNAFHPIREMLEDAADRYPRNDEALETLLVRYLGVEDSAYHREVARWVMVASVARIFEPGHKFDFAPILQGKTGIRKSAFIKALYGEKYFAEIDCNLGDTQAVAEIVSGVWGGELAELAGFHKADHNSAKSFMRRQIDRVRMAYDRRVTEFPRQMVVWGTTNEDKYLKDPTGNRSYWPIIVLLMMIDTVALEHERLSLWATALHIYRAMRAAQPKGELPLYLQSPEAQADALRLQSAARSEELHEMWAQKIQLWLDAPVRLSQFLDEIGATADAKFLEDGKAAHDVWVLRCAFTREQAVEFGLNRDRGVADYQTAQNIERALPLIEGFYQPRSDKLYRGGMVVRVRNKNGRWWLREGLSREEKTQGYRVVDGPVIYEDYEDDNSGLDML